MPICLPLPLFNCIEKYPFFKRKTVREKLDVIHAGVASPFELLCCHHSISLHSLFASVCTTLYYLSACEHLIQYFHKCH